MEKSQVIIPRLEKDGIPILFIPEAPVNFGRVCCYVRIGQHSEASLDYYNETKPDKFNACASLIKEWCTMGEPTKPVIRRRMQRKWLQAAWTR